MAGDLHLKSGRLWAPPLDEALLHVGAEQEGVNQPRFDQLLLVGSLDAVWTTGCQPPQGCLEHTQLVSQFSGMLEL